MEIVVNGDSRSVDDGTTLADLVVLYGLTPERVAIEVNAELVRRAQYADAQLSAGDRVEIVTLVGGG